jgi:hypothetical protein
MAFTYSAFTVKHSILNRYWLNNPFATVFLTLFFIGWCKPKLSYAQDTNQTSGIAQTRFISEKAYSRNLPMLFIDTILYRLDMFEPTIKQYLLYQDLGNAGSAARTLYFDAERALGFQYAHNPFEVYFKTSENLNYYNTKAPYTDISFTQGKTDLLFTHALHTQNITPRWNVGIDYEHLTSKGFLERQLTSHYNFGIFSSFTNKKQNYTLLANICRNAGVVQENGGISNDSLYELLNGNSKVVSPLLEGAQTRYKHRSGYIKQFWHLGDAEYAYKDADTLYGFRRKAHFSHTLKAEEYSYIFENTGNSDSILFPNQFYDVGNNTFDSAYYGNLTNRFAFALNNAESNRYSFVEVSLSHSMIAVAQEAFRRNYQNLTAEITAEKNNPEKYRFSYKTNAGLVLSGFNAGDAKAQAEIQYRLNGINIAVDGLYQQYVPDYTFLLFKSNAFIWDNDFEKVTLNKVGITFQTTGLKQQIILKINTHRLTNWVFANQQALPQQLSGNVSIQTFSLQHKANIGIFFMDHHLMMQQSTNENINLPLFGGMARYFIQHKFVKRMLFQIGVTTFYNSTYFANAYNPATRLFFVQQQREFGNYPVINPFVAGEIKQVSFFVKYEHLNQDWFNLQGFYNTQHYPISLRALRLGVRWKFYY